MGSGTSPVSEVKMEGLGEVPNDKVSTPGALLLACGLCGVTVKATTSQLTKITFKEHLEGDVHRMNSERNKGVYFLPKVSCKVCNVTNVTLFHMVGKKHGNNMENVERNIENVFSEKDLNALKTFCVENDVKLNNGVLDESSVRSILDKLDENKILCKVCNMHMVPKIESFNTHMDSKRHRKNMELAEGVLKYYLNLNKKMGDEPIPWLESSYFLKRSYDVPKKRKMEDYTAQNGEQEKKFCQYDLAMKVQANVKNEYVDIKEELDVENNRSMKDVDIKKEFTKNDVKEEATIKEEIYIKEESFESEINREVDRKTYEQVKEELDIENNLSMNKEVPLEEDIDIVQKINENPENPINIVEIKADCFSQKIFCKVCDVPMFNLCTFNDHMGGRRHWKNMENVERGIENIFSETDQNVLKSFCKNNDVELNIWARYDSSVDRKFVIKRNILKTM